MDIRKILAIAIFTIFWVLSAKDTHAVPIQSNPTEATILQGPYTFALLDLLSFDGQTFNGPFNFSQRMMTPLVTDKPALAAAYLPEDIINFGLRHPSSSRVTERTIQTNVVNRIFPVTASNAAYANSILLEALVAVNRPVSELQSSSSLSGDPGIDTSLYDFQYSYSIGFLGSFGFWYPYNSLWYPSYGFWYFSCGFWDPSGLWYTPFVEHHHHFDESAIPTGVERAPSAIPEPATLILLGSGVMVTLRKKNRR